MARRGSLEHDIESKLEVNVDSLLVKPLSSQQLRVSIDTISDDKYILRDNGGSGNEYAYTLNYWLTPVPTTAISLAFRWEEQGLISKSVVVSERDIAWSVWRSRRCRKS